MVTDLYTASSFPKPNVSGIAGNIASDDCPKSIVKAIETNSGGCLDILVNNAVHASRFPIRKIDSRQVQEELFANVQTPIMLLDELVKRKMFRSSSRIVDISSDTTRQPKVPAM